MKQNLSIASWNMNGLKSKTHCKLEDDYFVSLIDKYDIICLSETHVGPDISLTIPGYKAFKTHREKHPNAKKFSGGLVVFIKSTIEMGVSVLQVSNWQY